MKNKNLSLEGFTLLELLVVLTIIGILMTIGMAAYTGVIESATRRAVEVEISQFQIAIFNFKIEEGRLPSSPEELLSAGYITRELLKDPWGEDYLLREHEGRYQILSKGPDKKAGTKDDIVKTLD
ncbi:MAG: type II secretion system protein GspG [Brevinematales bacterium]|nr:type II secretion system protein GspG [Brevinematales bacterium]